MFSVLVFASLAVAAPVPKGLKPSDPTALLGTWELTAATYSGQPYPSAHGTKWTFRDDGTAKRDRPNDGISTAKYTLDPKTNPKAFDWNTEEGNSFLGIYELDGDTFRVCLQYDASKGRPTAMTDAGGTYQFEFKRAGAKK
jgi:uncharacterized protein (TIGR03067 family)